MESAMKIVQIKRTHTQTMPRISVDKLNQHDADLIRPLLRSGKLRRNPPSFAEGEYLWQLLALELSPFTKDIVPLGTRRNLFLPPTKVALLQGVAERIVATIPYQRRYGYLKRLSLGMINDR